MQGNGEKKIQRTYSTFSSSQTNERFIVVGVCHNNDGKEEEEYSLAELSRLVESAGGVVIASEIVVPRQIDPASYLTRGKAEQLAVQANALHADGVVFDFELAPAQQRNLEDIIECRILDRTTIILDIFARRASTREGKLQVELAQLNYLAPRLRGKGTMLSRLAGGIGTRGPGESKLETDRRKIRDRIHHLKQDIERVRRHRATQRKKRLKAGVPLIALTGYTNAGKSTLLNRLAHSDAVVADQLFATLDPMVRHIKLADGFEALVSDTVGFIKRLPTTLIVAFRATLEEASFAHLILHVVDVSSSRPEREIESTLEILEELKLDEKPRITVLNKSDIAYDRLVMNAMLQRYAPAVAISAVTGEGIEELQQIISIKLKDIFKIVEFQVPYPEISQLHKLFPADHYNITLDYKPNHVVVSAPLPPEDVTRLPEHWLKPDTSE
jgi:GTP-binding protein HflX